MSDPNPQDLNALIDTAASAVEKQEAKAAISNRRPIFKPVMSTLLTALVLLAVLFAWKELAAPGTKEITRDLEIVLEQARDVIEEAKKGTGELPETLPNASLASVVRYEQEQGDYKLSATIMGIRVTLERDGKKQIEKGVQE